MVQPHSGMLGSYEKMMKFSTNWYGVIPRIYWQGKEVKHRIVSIGCDCSCKKEMGIRIRPSADLSSHSLLKAFWICSISSLNDPYSTYRSIHGGTGFPVLPPGNTERAGPTGAISAMAWTFAPGSCGPEHMPSAPLGLSLLLRKKRNNKSYTIHLREEVGWGQHHN